jgi:hypothetical protein
MVILVVPFMFRAPAIVGWVMMIGTGDITWTMAAVPVALTGIVFQPSKRMRVAGTFL